MIPVMLAGNALRAGQPALPGSAATDKQRPIRPRVWNGNPNWLRVLRAYPAELPALADLHSDIHTHRYGSSPGGGTPRC